MQTRKVFEKIMSFCRKIYSTSSIGNKHFSCIIFVFSSKFNARQFTDESLRRKLILICKIFNNKVINQSS